MFCVTGEKGPPRAMRTSNVSSAIGTPKKKSTIKSDDSIIMNTQLVALCRCNSPELHLTSGDVGETKKKKVDTSGC
jgi:hypothetical protein